jgi:hypothetical protein
VKRRNEFGRIRPSRRVTAAYLATGRMMDRAGAQAVSRADQTRAWRPAQMRRGQDRKAYQWALAEARRELWLPWGIVITHERRFVVELAKYWAATMFSLWLGRGYGREPRWDGGASGASTENFFP